MSSTVLLSVFIIYAALLFIISRSTSRRAGDAAFYTGNRQSPWYAVAYGMIGASLSGVTFLSEPGWVGTTRFSYMMMVFGFVAGYIVISYLLLPLYYRLNLTSIYTYLDRRFGCFTYRTGAAFFILSRGTGAALRMFLTVHVLHVFVFGPLGIPFWTVAAVSVMLIVLYTFRGGIRTIVWTDTLQTTFMLLAVIITIGMICKSLGWNFSGMIANVWNSDYATVMITDWSDSRFFIKQFLGGMFVTIAMTGLDQDMMQKNLSCRNLRDARKNMLTFSGILVFVNLAFLLLGALLYIYAGEKSVITSSDTLFASISIHHLGAAAGIVFVTGLVAAAYSSADGALTALTTSFCIDIIGLDRRSMPDRKKRHTRYAVHFTFALLFLAFILAFQPFNDKAIIDRFYTIAGYTYGPLLGLFAFGLFTKFQVRDRAVPAIAIISPVITWILHTKSAQWFSGYEFGFELLLVNGIITFAGLLLCRKPACKQEAACSSGRA